MSKSPIVSKINALLAEKGISKQQFFKDCNITSASYSMWNTGKTQPRLKKVAEIAAYLGVTVYDLLSESPAALTKEKAPTQTGERSDDELTMQILEALKNADREQREAILTLLTRK